MKKNKLINPDTTAGKLWKVMTGFVALNINFDKENGKPDDNILKQRAANYGLIRQGVIATDFIARKGLDEEYGKYLKEVDRVVVRIRNGLAQNDDS